MQQQQQQQPRRMQYNSKCKRNEPSSRRNVMANQQIEEPIITDTNSNTRSLFIIYSFCIQVWMTTTVHHVAVWIAWMRNKMYAVKSSIRSVHSTILPFLYSFIFYQLIIVIDNGCGYVFSFSRSFFVVCSTPIRFNIHKTVTLHRPMYFQMVRKHEGLF